MYFGRLEFWRRRLEITTLAELRWKYCERVFWGEDVCGWNFWNWLLGNGGLMRMSRREGGKIYLIDWFIIIFFRNKGLMENGKLMKLSKNWLFIFREGERGEGDYRKIEDCCWNFDHNFVIFRENFDELWNLTKGKLMNLSGYFVFWD